MPCTMKGDTADRRQEGHALVRHSASVGEASPKETFDVHPAGGGRSPVHGSCEKVLSYGRPVS